MKNKIVFSLFLALVLGLFLIPKAKTEPNYSYKIYTPQNFGEVATNVQNTKEGGQILFIVDFSNSMNDVIAGVQKVDMARSTLAEILPKVPPNIKTGLRVYGHKAGFTYYQGCLASSLTVPLACFCILHRIFN